MDMDKRSERLGWGDEKILDSKGERDDVERKGGGMVVVYAASGSEDEQIKETFVEANISNDLPTHSLKRERQRKTNIYNDFCGLGGMKKEI